MFTFFFLVGLAVLVGMFASIRRNRSGLGWFLLSLIITPLLTFPLVAILLPLPPQPALSAEETKAAAAHDRQGWVAVGVVVSILVGGIYLLSLAAGH